jgi:hypothetical protein
MGSVCVIRVSGRRLRRCPPEDEPGPPPSRWNLLRHACPHATRAAPGPGPRGRRQPRQAPQLFASAFPQERRHCLSLPMSQKPSDAQTAVSFRTHPPRRQCICRRWRWLGLSHAALPSCSSGTPCAAPPPPPPLLPRPPAPPPLPGPENLRVGLSRARHMHTNAPYKVDLL